MKTYYALYNFNTLWSVKHKRFLCIAEAEEVTGLKWKECKSFFFVRKVMVVDMESKPKNRIKCDG